MATTISEVSETATIYEDRDNSFTLTLKKNGTTLTSAEMAAITKYEIRYSDTYYDSDTYASAFVADNSDGTVIVYPYSFGLAASVKSGEVVEFIVYDATNTNGLVWDQFILIVKDDAGVV